MSAAKPHNLFLYGLLAALGITATAEFLAPNYSENLDAVILILAVVASLAALARQLPLQNVLLVAAITAFIGGAAHTLTARTGIPFGPVLFNENGGPKIFDSLPWSLPFVWIIALLNSRGVARLSLRPWRKTKNYGWWLMGLTTVLIVGFDLALEPALARVKHLWLWQPTKISVTWFGASPLNFLGWAFVALLILAFTTPSLIKKQPKSSNAPDFAPLILWLGAIAFFAVTCGRAGLWPAVTLDALLAAATLVFAIRGAKW